MGLCWEPGTGWHGAIAALQVYGPAGGAFTHLLSLAPHAVEANGQNCKFSKTENSL